MILGLLIIILILYGLILFWVLNERLKSVSMMVCKANDQMKKMEEKIALLLSLIEERRNVDQSANIQDCFSFDTFENKQDDSHMKGDLL